MRKNSETFAAVDIGTNSFHLIIVKVKNNGHFEIIDTDKEVIRLGEGSASDIKQIHPESILRAIACLRRFKGIADSHNAELRAVATSAVRESLNKREFQEIILEKTGINIEVISGVEEARLIYLGILKAVPVYDKKVLCIDIGGGSTEFTVGEQGKILHSISLKLGAVRLTQKFFPDFIVTPERVKEAEKWVEGVLYTAFRKINKLRFTELIGSSGTIMSAGFMTFALRNPKRTKPAVLNNYKFTAQELNEVKKEVLSGETIDDRMKIPGLDSNRADIIPAGIIILSKIIEYCNNSDLTVSGYALREGIVIDTLNEYRGTDEDKPNLYEIRLESVKQLMNSCNYDKRHCQHVTNLALQLFDQLKSVHKLNFRAREFLESASLLHDIGYHIAHNQHHRHTQYIIKHAELLGFNESEILIISNVARYHRKSHPKEKHKDYQILNDENKIIVQKLSALLRIADALDRTHKKLVKMIDVIIDPDNIKLELFGEQGPPEIEIWSFERRKQLFEEIFGKDIYICS